jgi:hypothetical protein
LLTASPLATGLLAHLTTGSVAHLAASYVARLRTPLATRLLTRFAAGLRAESLSGLATLLVPLAAVSTTLLVSSARGTLRASLLGPVVFVFGHVFSPLAAESVRPAPGISAGEPVKRRHRLR